MVITMCSSGSVAIKAGKNVSTDITNANYEEWINQAESFINAVTRINYTDTYSTLNDDTKKILEDASSSHAALAAINFDLSQYSDLAEAQTMLDVNYTRLNDAVQLLKDKKHTDFVSGA